MIGFDDESELTEFAGEEDINPFEMTFDEAIFYFAEKNPVLYEHIQEITDEVKNRMFWIKKSNDLSITRSLIQNLIIALEDGQIYKQWVEASEDVLRVSGFGNNAWYTKLIWEETQCTVLTIMGLQFSRRVIRKINLMDFMTRLRTQGAALYAAN